MISREFRFFLKERLLRKRLDVILSTLFYNCSRVILISLLSCGFCKINFTIVYKINFIIINSCVLTICILFSKKTNWLFQEDSLNIIYEDKNIILIEKAFNIAVHPTNKIFINTVVNLLLHHFPTLVHLPRAGIVHRLDTPVSGLLVIAKNLLSYYSLVKQFRQRKILKFYTGFVGGQLFSPVTVDIPIFINKSQTFKRKLSAVTNICVQKVHFFYTHIRVYPKTGRLHQIRKHLSLLNHPILGDFLYGFMLLNDKNFYLKKFIIFFNNFNKIALHATSILLLHPVFKRYVFFATHVPVEFLYLLEDV